MHNFIINASLQIVPVTTDRHPYEWVDEAIKIIQQSGIDYKVGPFATVLEGTYTDIMKVINDVNEFLYRNNCVEWIANVQLHIKASADITSAEKTAKFN